LIFIFICPTNKFNCDYFGHFFIIIIINFFIFIFRELKLDPSSSSIHLLLLLYTHGATPLVEIIHRGNPVIWCIHFWGYFHILPKKNKVYIKM
jgi:hypothetical protein